MRNFIDCWGLTQLFNGGFVEVNRVDADAEGTTCFTGVGEG